MILYFLYIFTGIFTLFISPLKFFFLEIIKELIIDNLEIKSLKNLGLAIIGIVIILILIVITLHLYPLILFIRYLNQSKKLQEEKKGENENIYKEQIINPENNKLDAEYEYNSGKLISIKKYIYNKNNNLIEIESYNKLKELKWKTKYEYNNKNQRFAEINENLDTKLISREYHIFNSNNLIIETYGELESGHQYCHEFDYDEHGNKINLSKSILNNNVNLFEYFKIALKKQKEALDLKFINTKLSGSVSHYNIWSCYLCGGDETSGCLWHDPTECPR